MTRIDTTYEERYHIYTKVFNLMLDLRLISLPTRLRDICYSLKIEPVPLSRLLRSRPHIPENFYFEHWGNEDGVLEILTIKNKEIKKIFYNDYKPNGRIRFTIAEEIMHYVLDHYKSDNYSVFNENFNSSLYRKHDKEARIGAGLLLCPPPLFYYGSPGIDASSYVQTLCNVTGLCADTRLYTLKVFKEEIINHPLYNDVFELYKNFIDLVLCPHCGFGRSFNSDVLCEGCEQYLYSSTLYPVAF